ncbi:unnamed protein product [Phytophthora fragariaefolia]|uniref:Unnamed protein product n=1 Tax=Phytophthora fragariaefolia TaxID=1490495 RepID=A0A9W6XFM5_9STRA|nr:unnamed protein product [Phytophthora fragariaefolia]
MTLANIPSNADPLLPLGSLVVGDTFLFRGRSSSSMSPPAVNGVLHVTKPFANFRSWTQGGAEAEAVGVLMRTLQSDFMLQSRSVSLGKAITPLDADIETEGEGSTSQPAFSSKATLLLNSDLMPIVHGSWRIFTGGMVFTSPYFNPIIVSIERNVKSLTILPSPHEELILLKMDLNDDDSSHVTPVRPDFSFSTCCTSILIQLCYSQLSEALSFSLESQEIFIPLQSGTRFQDEVLRALECWKATAATLNTPIYRASDLNEQLEAGTPRDREVGTFEIPAQVKSACELLVSRQTFVGQGARISEDLFPQDFIPKDSGAATALPKPNTEDLSRLCVPVTVMLGIPGSGVGAMANSVCTISSASFEWVTVDVDLRNLDPSKQQKLEASVFVEILDKLRRALDRVKLAAKTVRLHPRIMLTVVGYIDPITVVCAIRRAALDAPLSSKIGAVINCVSATNVYLPDSFSTQAAFPKVFDQMQAGFVTHIVLTNSTDIEPAALQRLRFHMDHVNPFADVMVLSHDVFEGPLSPLLAYDRFESAYYKQYRNAHFREWDSATLSNNAAPSYTRYVTELESAHAPVSYRYEIVSGMDRSKFSFLIAKTLTPFATLTKSVDRVYPMDNAGNKNAKGIRIAQTIAVEKMRHDVNVSTTLSATPCAEGVFSNGQSRSCWCVEGQVVFKDELGCVYEYCSSGTFARLNTKGDSNLSMEMKVTGQGLNAEKLRELLLNCYAHAEASPHQVRSKASISLEEKREIQRQHVRIRYG